MRRIDRIQSMSVHELADAMIKTEVDGIIDYCPSSQECDDYEQEHGEISKEMCRECLIKWLMEEED